MRPFLNAFRTLFSHFRPAVLLRLIIHPSLFKVTVRHIFGIPLKIAGNKDHLESAMEWLSLSQDITGTGGSAASFGFESGWASPYPETSGYIISTFLRYSSIANDPDYIDRAIRMGDWEIEIQLPSGAVRGGSGINDYPIVFNTGMVILGWADLYKATKDKRYLNAAVRASDWLCSISESDGKWTRHTYNGIPHAYHSRVAWALLVMSDLTSSDLYRETALKNIRWVLSLASDNGWIDFMGFSQDEMPLTHTIAYTLRGLLESSEYLEGDLKHKVRKLVISNSERIFLKYEKRKRHPNANPEYLPGRFNAKWQPAARFSCLTGNAQFAIIWLKVYCMTSDARFLNASLKILDQLKEVQDLSSSNRGIRGGIPGSFPIWGEYMPWSYPNWATKFFADALILQEELMKPLEQK